MRLLRVLLASGERVRPRLIPNPDLAAEVRSWLDNAISTRQQLALPQQWPGMKAWVADYRGGLVVTVHRCEDDADGPASAVPVATIGVARHVAHGRPLWRVLTALPGASQVLELPPTPWFAVLDQASACAEFSLDSFAEICAVAWTDKPVGRRRGSSVKPSRSRWEGSTALVTLADPAALFMGNSPSENRPAGPDQMST